MKIINNDIKELEAHIIQRSDTRGIYEKKEYEINIANTYLDTKYETNDDIVYINQYVKYLNSLNEEEFIELIYFTKELFIKKFDEKYGSISFSNFFGGIMEDGENYSVLINTSNKINKILLKEFNNIHKYFHKNHKYEIGKYILICMKNLNIKTPELTSNEFYEYWENIELIK